MDTAQDSIKTRTPRGLRWLNGKWYMSYTLDGERVRKCLKTTDKHVAIEMLRDEKAAMKRRAANSVWEASLPNPNDRSWLRDMFHGARSRAGKRGFEFSLSMDNMLFLARRSGGYCEVTGLPFSDYNPEGHRVPPFKISIDRIDSREGYRLGNCRFVCYCVNIAMQQWGEPVLERMGMAMARKFMARQLGIGA